MKFLYALFIIAGLTAPANAFLVAGGSAASGPSPTNYLLAEDGVTNLVAEDGVTKLIQE